jgi:hypothetical protein
MQWIITKIGPEICDGHLVNTRIGVGRLPEETKRKIREAEAEHRALLVESIAQDAEFLFEFMTKCDDGHECYSGVCGDLDEADGDQAFEPLDYATADVGATEMWYRRKGETEWKQL